MTSSPGSAAASASSISRPCASPRTVVRLDISSSVSPIRDRRPDHRRRQDCPRYHRTEAVGAELAAQREWFRVTLGSIGDAVIASDPEGRVTYMNEPAQAVTGWSRADAERQPLADVFRIINEKDAAVDRQSR